MVEEVTTQSWGSRLKDAFVGILIGILLVAAAVYIVFWNENHGLHTAQSLTEVEKQLLAVSPSPIDSKNNLRVLYLNGLATTQDKLKDTVLNIEMKAIALIRTVEMYQWQEDTQTKTEKQMGGSEKTLKTYSYKKVWSEHLIDSSTFKEPSTHQNPTTMPVQSQREVAAHVTLGDFLLPASLVEQIIITTPVDLYALKLKPIEDKFKKPAHLLHNQLYLGQDAQNSQVGDLRINASAVLPQTISIIAQQTGNTLQAYNAHAGAPVLLLASGKQSSEEMIRSAEDENRMITWLLRLMTLIMIIIGFALLMRPLVVFADVLPIAGTIVGFGTGLIAFILGLGLWTIFTALAWFTTRPFLSIGLLLIVVIVGYFLLKLRRRKRT
ncbi:MAG: TMEM43 family protein [Legionella sp.]|nr:TMEM43 family protein [Legionella sp.]